MPSLLAILGPGLLLAATGVGGGDLATASIVGGLLGTTVLWAVVVGAFLKFVVTEGLTRWQLATGQTLIEGVVSRCGIFVAWLFLPYLLIWSFFVASAQMSAVGIALHALIPVFDDARDGKIAFGIVASLVGLGLVMRGGYHLAEKVMRTCVGVTFVTVVTTAVLLWPGFGPVLRGLFVPVLALSGEGLTWTVALVGGIGGTLTVLCYGYWLREEGRTAPEDLYICRLDLGMSYAMAAVFGVAMVIVGSHIKVEGEGTQLLVALSDRLGQELGPGGKWLFLIGTLGTVFGSLLGVWQAVPYLFADCWRLLHRRATHDERITVDTKSRAYRTYLVLLAILPMLGLFYSFREIQKFYTVIGASVFPLLTVALLVFNGKSAWVGKRFQNRPLTIVILLGILAFFVWIARAAF